MVGLIGLAAAVAAALVRPASFFPGYLYAYLFWSGLSLGAMAVLMVHYQVGGSWGYLTRRILESAVRTLPVMAVLFVPILFGLDRLYPWARPEEVSADPHLRHLRPYLNVGFFLVRTVLYFAIWLVFAYFLTRWSTLEDRSGDPELWARRRRLSGAGLVLYALTTYFASVDWVMSTEPHWSSTIYGLLFIASQALGAFALATATVVLLSGDREMAGLVTGKRLNDLGNLLLVFVMFWAYIALSQYLLIWSGNLPEEVVWYMRRIQGGWRWVIVFVIFFQFVLPFLLLLSRRTKTTVRTLAALAVLVLFVHLVDLFWLIVPPFRPQGLSFHWLDLAAPIGVGGIWVATFVWLLRRRAILPLHDPRVASFQEAVEHG